MAFGKKRNPSRVFLTLEAVANLNRFKGLRPLEGFKNKNRKPNSLQYNQFNRCTITKMK